MKHNVKFSPSYSMLSFSPPLEFQGKGNVDMTETGILADGNLPRFYIPFIGWFYSALFCARTTRTIPYSRIKTYRFSGNWINLGLGKVLLLLLVIAGAVAATWLTLSNSTDPLVYLTALWGMVTALALLLLLTGVRQHRIAYLLPDNKTRRIAFRLQGASRKEVDEFSAQLREYMTAAQQYGKQQAAAKVKS